MDLPFSIFSYTQKEYAEKVYSVLKRGFDHAKHLYSDFFKKGFIDLEASWIEPQAKVLMQEIISLTDFSVPSLSFTKEEGLVSKFLLKYADGLETECVFIPMKFGNTLCISSQIGCRMGCSFCETGKMGLIRHLTTSEICTQVFGARFFIKANIRNLVFMGMGEPFDNYENVMQAIKVLSCDGGFGISPSRITVSTSGKVPEMARFSKEAPVSLKLAVSLHAANDLLRSKLMLINKEWSLASLKQAMIQYTSHPRRSVFIEYVLINHVNDSLEHALELAHYLEGLKVKVNLIPYNSQSSGRFIAPSQEKMDVFKRYLQEKGFQTFLRTTRGSSIMAACGQLGNRNLKKIEKKLGSKSLLSVLCEVTDP